MRGKARRREATYSGKVAAAPWRSSGPGTDKARTIRAKRKPRLPKISGLGEHVGKTPPKEGNSAFGRRLQREGISAGWLAPAAFGITCIRGGFSEQPGGRHMQALRQADEFVVRDVALAAFDF